VNITHALRRSLLLWLGLMLLSACAPAPDPGPLATLQAESAELRLALTALAPTIEYLGRPSPTPPPSATPSPLPPATATSNPTLTRIPTLTPAPTTAPTATPAAYAYVEGPVSVRVGPGAIYAVMGTALAGQRFAITGRDAGATWWQIDFAGLAGWVSADVVKAEFVENVAQAAEIPTPKPTLAVRSAPAPVPSDTPDPCRYIGNKNSKKFHLAACEWAKKTSEQNRVCFATREEAIAQGYEPCKVCQP